MNPREIASLLRAEGLEVELIDRSTIVEAWFEIDGERVPVFVITPAEPRYFILFAPAVTPIPFEQLEAPRLRELIRASSDVELAKLVYQEFPGEDGFFAAVSECSVDGYNGRKLRLRMEACARLARRIETILG